jgi:hypothetical protein
LLARIWVIKGFYFRIYVFRSCPSSSGEKFRRTGAYGSKTC